LRDIRDKLYEAEYKERARRDLDEYSQSVSQIRSAISTAQSFEQLLSLMRRCLQLSIKPSPVNFGSIDVWLDFPPQDSSRCVISASLKEEFKILVEDLKIACFKILDYTGWVGTFIQAYEERPLPYPKGEIFLRGVLKNRAILKAREKLMEREERLGSRSLLLHHRLPVLEDPSFNWHYGITSENAILIQFNSLMLR
jgi:hypothetical protein